MISIIAAVGQNGELGKNGDLIWRLKDDMKFFKEKTAHHTIVMGRQTFESLHGLLPNRTHIVLSRSNLQVPDVKVYHNIQDFLNDYQNTDTEVFNIGGASIYKALLPYTSNLYLTEIEASDQKADTYFPSFDKDNYTKEILGTNQDQASKIKYKHVLYKRR